MAKVFNEHPVSLIHGKIQKNASGYFYVTPFGKQKFRARREDYQQKRSPKQLWHTASFVWAHQQIRLVWDDPEQVAQITQEWKDAMRRTPDGKLYIDAKGWKFACLQLQWKTEHPYEQWYENYLLQIAEKADEKTSAESVSDYMLRHQAEILEAQAAALRAQLKERHPNDD